MAVDSLDEVGAGVLPPNEFFKSLSGTLVTNRPFSYFYSNGIPAPAVASSAGVNGEALTSYPGQLPFTNPPGGSETRLARFVGQVIPNNGTLLLCDRLWHNSGLSTTSTATQSFSAPTWPARDANGTTDGEQVLMGVEVTATTGAGVPALNVEYTNSAGVSTQLGVGLISAVATSLPGSFYVIGLQAGDTGVRKALTYRQTATWTTGSISLVAFRVLARLDMPVSGHVNALDWITGGAVRAYDNTVPFLVFIPAAVTSASCNGHVVWTQG